MICIVVVLGLVVPVSATLLFTEHAMIAFGQVLKQLFFSKLVKLEDTPLTLCYFPRDRQLCLNRETPPPPSHTYAHLPL